jgi:hypothetical protein
MLKTKCRDSISLSTIITDHLGLILQVVVAAAEAVERPEKSLH